MNNFHQTRMGQSFFEAHVPQIVRSLNEIADEMKTSNKLKEKELELKERELELEHKKMNER